LEPLLVLNESIRKFKSIIIYGTGAAAGTILMMLLERNIKVECFTDGKLDNCNKKYFNLPVYYIKDQSLLSKKEEAAVIISGLFTREIAVELDKLGFKHLFYELIEHVHLDTGGTK
jgi:prephenate dehydrogenase